jgi:hypothetical protein
MTDQEMFDPGEENRIVKVDLDSIEEDLTTSSTLFKDFCKYYVAKEERNPFTPGWEEKMEILQNIVREKLN